MCVMLKSKCSPGSKGGEANTKLAFEESEKKSGKRFSWGLGGGCVTGRTHFLAAPKIR